MDWTATVDRIEKDPTNANIKVTFTITNGVDVTVTDCIPGNDITPEWLANLAAVRIAVYQAREDAIAALRVGPITPALAPPANPLLLALQRVARLKGLVDLGIKKPDDADYIAAVDEAKRLQAEADQAAVAAVVA